MRRVIVPFLRDRVRVIQGFTLVLVLIFAPHNIATGGFLGDVLGLNGASDHLGDQLRDVAARFNAAFDATTEKFLNGLDAQVRVLVNQTNRSLIDIQQLQEKIHNEMSAEIDKIGEKSTSLVVHDVTRSFAIAFQTLFLIALLTVGFVFLLLAVATRKSRRRIIATVALEISVGAALYFFVSSYVDRQLENQLEPYRIEAERLDSAGNFSEAAKQWAILRYSNDSAGRYFFSRDLILTGYLDHPVNDVASLQRAISNFLNEYRDAATDPWIGAIRVAVASKYGQIKTVDKGRVETTNDVNNFFSDKCEKGAITGGEATIGALGAISQVGLTLDDLSMPVLDKLLLARDYLNKKIHCMGSSTALRHLRYEIDDRLLTVISLGAPIDRARAGVASQTLVGEQNDDLSAIGTYDTVRMKTIRLEYFDVPPRVITLGTQIAQLRDYIDYYKKNYGEQVAQSSSRKENRCEFHGMDHEGHGHEFDRPPPPPPPPPDVKWNADLALAKKEFDELSKAFEESVRSEADRTYPSRALANYITLSLAPALIARAVKRQRLSNYVHEIDLLSDSNSQGAFAGTAACLAYEAGLISGTDSWKMSLDKNHRKSTGDGMAGTLGIGTIVQGIVTVSPEEGAPICRTKSANIKRNFLARDLVPLYFARDAADVTASEPVDHTFAEAPAAPTMVANCTNVLATRELKLKALKELGNGECAGSDQKAIAQCESKRRQVETEWRRASAATVAAGCTVKE